MFQPPARVNVFTLPGQEEGARNFGHSGKNVRSVMQFLKLCIWERSGKCPNHYWLNESDWMRLELHKNKWFIDELKATDTHLHPYRGLIGVHAAYLRQGTTTTNVWTGTPHPDLTSCPEFYAVVVPSYWKCFENSYPKGELVEGYRYV